MSARTADISGIAYTGFVTTRTLPDDVLLQIFGLVIHSYQDETWHGLIHVCRRWRRIIFVSPRGLDPRIICTARNPVKEMLHIWPTLPIKIRVPNATRKRRLAHNIIDALDLNDRVEEILLENVPTALLERIAAVTQGHSLS